jgi:hypothetical protein
VVDLVITRLASLSEEQIDADLGVGLPSPIGEQSPGEPFTRRR